MLTLERLRWSATSARFLVTDFGTTVDLLALAPKAVANLAKAAAGQRSDNSALSQQGSEMTDHWAAPLFWEAMHVKSEGARESEKRRQLFKDSQ